MATSSKRDVRLGVEITTAGEESIRKLAADVRSLAKEGGDAAPEYARVADELDRLSRQAAGLDELKRLTADVERLGLAQADAAKSAAALKATLTEQQAAVGQLRESQSLAERAVRDAAASYEQSRSALRVLKTEYDDSGKRAADYATRLRDLTKSQEDARAVLLQRKNDLADANKALSEAAAAERTLASQYRGQAADVEASNRALRARQEALRQAQAAMVGLGVAVDSLERAEAQLLEQTQASAAAARQQQQLTEAQAIADREAALAAGALVEARRRGAAAAESELAAIRDSEEFLRRYAATQAQAAADALRFVEAEEAAAVAAEKASRRVAELNAQAQRTAQNSKYVDDLAAALARADTEAEQAAAAAKRFSTEFGAAGRQLNDAFGTTGVRSLQAIEREIGQVDAAVSLLQRQFRAGAISAEDLSRAVSSATVRLEVLKREASTIPALPDAFERINSSITGLVSKFGSLTAAIGTVGFAVKPVIDATVALEQMRRVLTTVTGSAESAQQNIAFLRQTAQQSGTSFTETGQAYAKFAASALQVGLSVDQVQAAFKSVALASGNLGLSSDQAKRALEALSQIASKGTANMEELRQQLGDALPGVLPLLARELGLTTKQLNDVVESGNLLSSEAIPAIARALQELGPKNGAAVSGMVAEWNRFKNVVAEAGTSIVEGPLGQAAGTVLIAFAGAIRDVAFVAVSASEGIKAIGNAIGATAGFIAGGMRDFDGYRKTLSDFALESAARIERFKDTAYGAEAGAKALGQSSAASASGMQAAGAAAASVATTAAQATTAVDGTTAALGATAAAAQGAAVAQNAAAAATERVATAADAAGPALAKAGESYAALALRTQAAIDQAEAEARARQKLAEAAKSEGEAIARRIAIAGDEEASRQAQADAAQAVARAARENAAAEDAVVAALQRGRAERVAYLEAQRATKERIAEVTKELDTKIQAAEAEAEKARQSASAAEAEAAARKVAAESLKDNSSRYKELTEAVAAAREELLRVSKAYAQGKASSDALEASTIKLSKALALQRDALQDLARNAQLDVEALKVRNALSAATSAGRLEEARANLQVAQSLGDTRAAAQAEVDVKRLQRDEILRVADAKRAEANATIESLARQREATLGDDEASRVKRREIDIRIEAEKVKLREADASRAVVRGIEAEIDAIQRRNQAALSGIGDRNNGITLDENGRTAYQRDLLSKQGGPVDNSFIFDVQRRLNSGGTFSAQELPALQNALRVAQENAFLAGTSSVPNLNALQDSQNWVNVLRRAIEQVSGPTLTPSIVPQKGGFGLSGSGQPSSSAPAATQPSTGRTVRLELAIGGQTVSVDAPEGQASTLLAAIESARRARGS